MSTDRELLELAAKAAAVCVIRSRLDDPACQDMLVKDSQRNPSNVMGQWNPLTDDGDALRLAAQLRIDVEHNNAGDQQRYVVASRSGCEGCFAPVSCIEDDFDESCRVGATRRAIVRAAAEIGRAEK